MKKVIPAVAMILGGALAAWAEPPVTLTTLHEIHKLTNVEASQSPPVAFEATVTYFSPRTHNLIVQDGAYATFVRTSTSGPLLPGERILVRGKMVPSYLPVVESNNFTPIGQGEMPLSVPATFDDLFGTRLDCRYVRVRGVVRTADLLTDPKGPSSRLRLLMDGGFISVELDNNDESALKNLLDAEVEVTGAAMRLSDGKGQQVEVGVRIVSLENIKVLKSASASAWTLPVTPMSNIMVGAHVQDLSHRLRIHGTVTYYQPGTALVLQSGSDSLWVSTETSDPLQIGDVVDATGFADGHDRRLTLVHAEIQDTGLQAPIPPQLATWRQLAFWGKSPHRGHQYDLVSIEGHVVNEVREAAQDEYVLVSDGRMFSVIYHHPSPPSPIPPMLQVPLGSTLRVTGICIIADTRAFNEETPFNILIRSFDDITVVASPSLLSIRNLMLVVALLLAVVFVAVARGWALERKMRRQAAAMSVRVEVEAVLERQRSRILEDINGSRPLPEILEEIIEFVSFRLDGASCWCETVDGQRLGNYPPNVHDRRVVQKEIPAHAGSRLGVFFAALDPLTAQAAIEQGALSSGVRLATLAIETRRLYVDLCRRSEFDQLTEVHNRFSLEKCLDAQISEAGKSASIFGLIYIDLDKFKAVNDHYGHHVGDIYLQEAARRMKRQLRDGDVMARLGGDEFSALVSMALNRSEVEEVALRLERCLDEPFSIEGNLLQCSASVGIALYPDDGATGDRLLNSADAAMYVVKNARRTVENNLAEICQPAL